MVQSSWESVGEELRLLAKAFDKPCENQPESSQWAESRPLFWLCLNMRTVTSEWTITTGQLS